MNLIPLGFGLREWARDQPAVAFAVHFDSVLVGLLFGESENLHQHFDHVLVGVIVVVQQNYVIEGFRLVLILVQGFFFNLGKNNGSAHDKIVRAGLDVPNAASWDRKESEASAFRGTRGTCQEPPIAEPLTATRIRLYRRSDK